MRALPYALFIAAAAIFPMAPVRVFLETPNERTMGTAFKIFFFHVPMAWIFMLLAVVCGVAAGIELRRRSRRAAAVARASAEVSFLCGAGVLLTGPIWGNATWGEPWTGDARQMTTALLWLVVASYLLVRQYGGPSSRRLAAGLAIFGAVDVPIIYYAVKIWKTLHPTTDVVTTLPPSMRAALWPALCALLLVSLGLVIVRTRQVALEADLDEAWVELDRQAQGVTA
ncbi:MAG: cytochrome c biogenesis protein CcsA [Nannocystaceae bacterium]|nr:cytochrome c biogenesis protein CcsA [Myxococcales bacterium]